jgi:hypothetical protein
MSPPADATISSARPEDLHRYHEEIIRHHARTTRALRSAQACAATYEASCPDVALTLPPLDTLAAALGRLRGFASKVSTVGEAFELADRQPTGGLARTTDRSLAEVVAARFPMLANTAILGDVATDLAEGVAEGLRRAAVDDRTDLAELRGSVPTVLAADPVFARAVLSRLDPHHLAMLTRTIADTAYPGSSSPDLVWLADLFARGAGTRNGDASEATLELVRSRAGRNAVRILRAGSTTSLAPGVLETVALALVLHPVSTDRPPTHSPFAAFLERGDTAVLEDAARVTGLARRLLTGPDPARPVHGRTAAFIERRAGTDQVGVAALLEAALSDPDTVEADGALAPAGLELVLGTIAGVSRVDHSGAPSDHLAGEVLDQAARVVVAHPQVLAHHTVSSEPTVAQARLEELTSALHHLAESPDHVARLAAGLRAARRDAQAIALDRGDTFHLELVGRLHAALEEGAVRADVPRRPLDPVLDLAGEAVLLGLASAVGARGATLGRPPVEAIRDHSSDLLAEEEGTAARRLSRQMASGVELALLLVDHPPPGTEIIWSGSGLANRAELEALGGDPGDQAVLAQWVRVQGPAVHDVLDRMDAAYHRGRDAAR